MTHSLIYRLIIMALGIPYLAHAEEQTPQSIQQCYSAVEMPAKLSQLSSKDNRLQILSDRIRMMQDQTALFDGNIEILYRDTMLNAANARVSQKEQTLVASGGIQYYSPDLKVSSSKFSAQLKEDKAVLSEANYQLVSQSGRGYAKEMSDDYKRRQAELVAETLKKQDIAICTALIPGRKAPTLINDEMVHSMRPGSVIVDLAAEQGGNCTLTKPGEVVEINGVTIIGLFNIPSRLSADASALYAKNILNFVRIRVVI